MRNRTQNQVTLAFIRHGETQANKEHRYLGRTDEALSESGIEILQSYKKRNDYPDVAYLFTSPMKRCRQTAEILFPKLCPVIIPEWAEMDFGEFEYQNYEDLKDNAFYQAWIDSGGCLDFPGGESRRDFILRCEKGFIRMCAELRRMIERDCGCGVEEGTIRAGIIVHGGTIMALLSSHGGRNYFDYQTANGRGYLCSIEGWAHSARIKEVVKI